MKFDQRKQTILEELNNDQTDKSRKGNVDAPIIKLIEKVNQHPDYVTTSSCSGRISIFGNKPPKDVCQKGGDWLFVNHEKVENAEKIIQLLQTRLAQLGEDQTDPEITFRFEPFILAIECRNAEFAGKGLIDCGRQAGFRESGMTISSQNRVMAAIRCSLRLEVPILFVTGWKEYVEYLVTLSNTKMDENFQRIANFEQLFESQLKSLQSPPQLLPQKGIIIQEEWYTKLGQSDSVRDLLCRWGHCGCVVGDCLYVFGGYGGGSEAHQRLNDLLIISLSSEKEAVEQLKQGESGDESWPSSRMGACMVAEGSQLYLIGGRTNPEQPLNDVWRFDTSTRLWEEIVTVGDTFIGRHRHSAVQYNNQIIVFGGCIVEGVSNELFVFNIATSKWKQIQNYNDCSPPPPTKSHAACIVNDNMYIFGGRSSYEDVQNALHVLSLNSLQWTRVVGNNSTKFWPPACFSHSLTAYQDRYILLIGGVGYTDKSGKEIYVLDTQFDSYDWKMIKDCAPENAVPIRHVSCVWNNKMLVIGGGAFCFSFGTTFGESYCLDNLDKYIVQGSSSNNKENEFRSSKRQKQEETMRTCASFKVRKKDAKMVKDCLKLLGWLDRSVRAIVEQEYVYFPLTEIGKQSINDIAQVKVEKDTHVQALLILKQFLVDGQESIRESNIQHKILNIKDPKQQLELQAEDFIRNEKGISDEVMIQQIIKSVPKKWELVGDVVLFPQNSFQQDFWQQADDKFWSQVCSILGCSRVGIQQRIADNGTRDSLVRMVYGNDGWVTHKENGILYSFDVTKCMFSSGNVSEKCRIGDQNFKGKVIVDLFAGIGYYTLPALIRAGADFAYACDWNPPAVKALTKNLEINKVSQKCSILQGDCREVAPKAVADVVFLGILPESQFAWKTAVQALKHTGGVLYIHNNVKDTDLKQWKQNCIEQIQKITDQCFEQQMIVYEQHCEFVKWYAPHIKHIVLEVCLEQHVQINISADNQSQNKQVPIIAQQRQSNYSFKQQICAQRKPVVLRGYIDSQVVNMFKAEQLYSEKDLESKTVSVHVCGNETGMMDFTTRNFEFKTMSFRELIGRCSGIGGPWRNLIDDNINNEFYYLRSIGENPRKEAANLKQSFPELYNNIKLPSWIPCNEKVVHSSVLRISSPELQLWTHYDVMDNVLIQLQGSKRVRLWHPLEWKNLYIQGSSSEVVDVENPDLQKYPLFSNAEYIDVTLQEGDILFIPALWFHNVKSNSFSVSINIFWRDLPKQLYQSKDLYGNRDPVAAENAEQQIEAAMQALKQLPKDYAQFYASKFSTIIQRGFGLEE